MVGRSRAALVATVLAVACVRSVDELPADLRIAGAATVETWRAEGFPAPSASCDLAAFRVLEVGGRAFTARCGVPPEAAYACLNWDVSGVLRKRRRVPVFVVSPIARVGPAHVVHEMIHALSQCGGMPRGHGDARLWSMTGGASSLEQRIKATLGAP